MKPYRCKNMADDQCIFNYRLSRKRGVTENLFGIWVNKFRVFSVRINLNKSNVSTVVLASTVFHNMLRENQQIHTQHQNLLIKLTSVVT